MRVSQDLSVLGRYCDDPKFRDKPDTAMLQYATDRDSRTREKEEEDLTRGRGWGRRWRWGKTLVSPDREKKESRSTVPLSRESWVRDLARIIGIHSVWIQICLAKKMLELLNILRTHVAAQALVVRVVQDVSTVTSAAQKEQATIAVRLKVELVVAVYGSN
ncbi:hypothetical protein Scep_028211 [Stephania cephalantha]|uniref:Uncharacterized protein n=1 Tax=Stephania cephalantha TaxID=152367 RepID=A0AAP0HJB8_9MAGN